MGRMIIRPYMAGWLDDNDSMQVVWHDHELIQFSHWEMCRNGLPALLHVVASFIQNYTAFHNSAQ